MAEALKILVINQNKNSQYLPYAAQYQLFGEWDHAIYAAKLIGWEDPFGAGPDKKVGMANTYQCGDVKVMIIALDES